MRSTRVACTSALRGGPGRAEIVSKVSDSYMVDLVVAVMTVGRERTLAPFRLELTQGSNQVTRFADGRKRGKSLCHRYMYRTKFYPTINYQL